MKSIRSAVAALPLFAAALAFVGATPAPSFDATPYLHVQRLVDIGGRRLNLYCTGSGSPTVILDSDGDDSTLQWRFVQPIVAKTTRVCSYDIAGVGFSDPAPAPRDASAFSTDLHRLLQKGGIAKPVVLVGYSLSGLTDRLYADRYPNDVAAMVLVDPNVPYEGTRLRAVVPALGDISNGTLSWDTQCLDAATRGTMTPGSSIFKQCMWPTGPADPRLPKNLSALLERQWQRSGSWRDLLWAERAQTNSSSEVRREQRRYDSMPLIVLTSDTRSLHLPLPEAEIGALAHAWMSWHSAIAAYSTRGTNLLVRGSTESIAIDRPASVSSAIDEVIDQVRYPH